MKHAITSKTVIAKTAYLADTACGNHVNTWFPVAVLMMARYVICPRKGNITVVPCGERQLEFPTSG